MFADNESSRSNDTTNSDSSLSSMCPLYCSFSEYNNILFTEERSYDGVRPLPLSDFGDDSNKNCILKILYDDSERELFKEFVNNEGGDVVFRYWKNPNNNYNRYVEGRKEENINDPFYFRFSLNGLYDEYDTRLISNLMLCNREATTSSIIYEQVLAPHNDENNSRKENPRRKFYVPNVKKDSIEETPYCHFDKNNKSFLGPSHYEKVINKVKSIDLFQSIISKVNDLDLNLPQVKEGGYVHFCNEDVYEKSNLVLITGLLRID